jgi:hypothetical protein
VVSLVRCDGATRLDAIHWPSGAGASAVPVGKEGRSVPPYLAKELYAAAGETKEERWYDSGHGLPASAYLDMIDWLARRIGIAPVSATERANVSSGAQ